MAMPDAAPRISQDTFAEVVYGLDWTSADASHTERLHVGRVNLWRDILPPGLDKRLMGLAPGQSARTDVTPGAEGLPAYDSSLVRRIPRKAFAPHLVRHLRGMDVTPRLGRFYPLGVLRGLQGVFPQNSRPMRIVEMNEAVLTIDTNPPLAQSLTANDVTIRADVLSVSPKPGDTGGHCRHVLECLTQWGPGMQARRQSVPTDYFSGNALERPDETPDAAFYTQPRLVGHVDARCSRLLTDLHERLLPPGGRVLDLMAGFQSHLPDGIEPTLITGLGMNDVEMNANPALGRHVVHDLNADPRLPFADMSFDAVICAMSVEYLTRPLEVLAEVARVLVPGGVFVVSFSHRWFPPKAVRIWGELHEFERLGLVLELFVDSGVFSDLRTLSERGWPRPFDENDRYIDRLQSADPLFAVWGAKRFV